MKDKDININALGQAIDTSWGRSSTPQSSSFSVKFSLLGGNRLLASYQVIVNFVSEKEMILMKRNCIEESAAIVASCLKGVKATYKDLSGQTLTAKEESSSDSLEIIGFNSHNPKRTAYFRRKIIFELA